MIGALALGDVAGVEVVEDIACRVDEQLGIAVVVDGSRMHITGREHVATKTKIVVRQIHLSQQGGADVALVTEGCDGAWLLDGAAQPQQRDMIAQQGLLLVDVLIVDAMIGHEHDEQVLPLWGGLEFGDEIAQTIVEIAERIQYFVVITLQGHIPGLMTAQGGVAHKETPGAIGSADLVIERAEGDIVSYAPFGCTLFLA